MRGFVEDHGALFAFQRLQQGAAFAGFARQEAFEGEAVGGQARQRQRGCHSGGAGCAGYGQSAVGYGFHHVVAGVGNTGHAGVGEQHDAHAGIDGIGDSFSAGLFVVVEQAHDFGRVLDFEAFG